MGAKTKSSTVRYLQRKRNTYYARVRAPQDLRSGTNDEIWRSLDTSDRREALERLPSAVAAIRAEFEQRRASLGRHLGASSPKPITLEETDKIAALWVRSCLLTDEQDRVEGLDDEDYNALTKQLDDAVKGLGQASFACGMVGLPEGKTRTAIEHAAQLGFTTLFDAAFWACAVEALFAIPTMFVSAHTAWHLWRLMFTWPMLGIFGTFAFFTTLSAIHQPSKRYRQPYV